MKQRTPRTSARPTNELDDTELRRLARRIEALEADSEALYAELATWRAAFGAVGAAISVAVRAA